MESEQHTENCIADENNTEVLAGANNTELDVVDPDESVPGSTLLGSELTTVGNAASVAVPMLVIDERTSDTPELECALTMEDDSIQRRSVEEACLTFDVVPSEKQNTLGAVRLLVKRKPRLLWRLFSMRSVQLTTNFMVYLDACCKRFPKRMGYMLTSPMWQCQRLSRLSIVSLE